MKARSSLVKVLIATKHKDSKYSMSPQVLLRAEIKISKGESDLVFQALKEKDIFLHKERISFSCKTYWVYFTHTLLHSNPHVTAVSNIFETTMLSVRKSVSIRCQNDELY